MSKEHTPGNPQESLRPEDRLLRTLFRDSFRFSQAGEPLQYNIAQWLHLNGHLDGIKIPQSIPNFLLDITIPKRHVQFKDSEEEALIEMGKTLTNMWGEFHRATLTPQDTPVSEIEDTIVVELLSREKYFQESGRSGREAAADVEPDSPNDMYGSQFRKYVLHQAPTGTPIYDAFFANVRERVLPAQFEGRVMGYREQVEELAALWERNHPGERFIAEQQDDIFIRSEPTVGSSANAAIGDQEQRAQQISQHSRKGNVKTK